jgi:hypothetical protein
VSVQVNGIVADATAKIGSVTAQVQGLLDRSPVEVKVDAKTEDAQRKLAALDVNAERLKKAFPEFAVKLDTGLATAKLTALRAEIRKTAETGGGAGAAGGASGGFLGLLGPLGALFSGGSGIAIGIAALTPVIAALGTVSLAAGAGIAGFGALALPTFLKISTALSKISKDQQAVTQATTHGAKTAALATLKADYASLPAPIATAVKAVQGLETAFGKLAKAFQPEALKMLGIGLKIAGDAMGPLAVIAKTAAPFVDAIAKSIGVTLVKSLKLLEPQIKPAMGAFVPLLGSISKLFLVLLASLLKNIPTWVKLTNAIIALINATTPLIPYLVDFIAEMGRVEVVVIRAVAWFLTRLPNAIKATIHWIANAIDKFREVVVQIGQAVNAIGASITQMVLDVGSGIGKVVSFFTHLPGRIASALSGLGTLLYNIGKHAVQMIINGMLSLWHKLTGLFDRIKGFLGFGGGGGGVPGGKLPNVNVGLGSGSANASLARQMMPSWGTGANWAAWNYVGQRESGWNSTIQNAASGALGIAQALGHGVAGGGGSLGNEYGGYGLSTAGDRLANSGVPQPQISWMVNYIRSKYGGPQQAAAHERAFNWYDRGGFIPTGASVAINNTGAPERVLSGSQEMAIVSLLRDIRDILRQSPSATGTAMARGLQGTARRAGARGMYSARGPWA